MAPHSYFTSSVTMVMSLAKLAVFMGLSNITQ